MEAGFKRLWSRKKSWGSADQPSRPRRLSSSNGANGQSQLTALGGREGRPSIASSYRQQEQPPSRDKFSGSRDLLSGTPNDEFGRTKSGHRIQPMLVGISRPDTGRERPDTAGSLQSAVQRAADAVGGRPSDLSTRPVTTKPPQVVKQPSRHVDIFSVAASVPSYMSRYNEEIAERNLDTYRLVLESTPYVYDPSSKYQEEVATRNAYLPYKTRGSTDTSRRSVDHDRTTSMTNRSIRSIVSPQPNGVHSYQLSTDSAGPGQKVVQEQSVQYSRQLGSRSREGAYTPQEAGSGDGPLKKDEVRMVQQQPYSPSRLNNAPRDSRMQTIAEGQPYETRYTTSATSATPRDSGHASYNTSTDYKISAAEQGGYPTTNRSNYGDRSHDPSSFDNLFGPPSSRSVASLNKRTLILPNRTVMDLTDEPEHFSETSSGFNYSPVIEQAKSDAFRRIVPSQIHTEERRGSRSTDMFSDTPIATPVPRRDVYPAVTSRFAPTSAPSIGPVHERVQALEMAVPVALAPDTMQDLGIEMQPSLPVLETAQLERKPVAINSSSFSPISTVASWSPRSSAYIPSPAEPISMTVRAAAALEASKAITKENPMPVTARNGAEAPTVKERVASFEHGAERGTSPSSSIAEVSSSLGKKKVPSAMAMMGNPMVQPPKIESMKAPIAKSDRKAPSTSTLYASPESIRSVDYIDPSSSFGIRTRDFAVTPRKSDAKPNNTDLRKAVVPPQSTKTPVKVESKGKSTETKTRSTKPRAKTSTPASAKPKDTGFDEEAFARKQADARAALERLQRSLSDDFLTLPERSSVKPSKGKKPEGQSAPTFILPPEQSSVPPPIPQRADLDKPPPSAFRNSRGSMEKGTLASNTGSLSTGSRSVRRAPAPSSLKNVEPATNPIDHNMLSPALLQAMQHSFKPPKSPGEISLSSFPVPSSSRPSSQPDAPAGYHSHTNSFVGVMKRRNSTKSQGSAASTFSIPYHMVPGRTSSVQDPVPEEGDLVSA